MIRKFLLYGALPLFVLLGISAAAFVIINNKCKVIIMSATPEAAEVKYDDYEAFDIRFNSIGRRELPVIIVKPLKVFGFKLPMIVFLYDVKFKRVIGGQDITRRYGCTIIPFGTGFIPIK